MALTFRPSNALPESRAFNATAFDQGVSWFERRSASNDIELPRRAASYLIKRGLSRDDTARALATEFDLSPVVAATVAATV